MIFIDAFEQGQKGRNKGLPLGPGLINITKAINGIQRGAIYVIASAPKCGKSTLVDYGWLLHPYIYVMKHNETCLKEDRIDIEWIYYSFEIDRVSKEFDVVAFFLAEDFGVEYYKLPEGVLKDGQPYVEISSSLLRGRVFDDKENLIVMSPEMVDKIKTIYNTRIVPLFGQYTKEGKQIKKGFITFVDHKGTALQLREHLIEFAEKRGTFFRADTQDKNKITGYTAKNPKMWTLVITDHLRKIVPDKGFLKKAVDDYSQYTVEIKNMCMYTFIDIIHLNRNMSDMSRQKAYGDRIYPNSDDIKDTGNLSEDANFVFTMFDPNDQRYNLSTYFGEAIKDQNDNLIYPGLRTIHLVESRDCPFPQHFRTIMKGNIKSFKLVKKKKVPTKK